MADFKMLVDLIVNAMLNAWNALKSGMGFWFLIWVVCWFIMPWFKKLIRALRS